MRELFEEARAAWYRAYVEGDVRQLEILESESLVVISPRGIEDQSTRLQSIASAVDEGKWFPKGSRAEDIEMAISHTAPGVISVHGIGRISSPNENKGVVFFTELWKQTGDKWQVVHLHYHGRKS